MSPEVSEYLRQIKLALQEHEQQRLFTAVAELIENNPVYAALAIWDRLFSEGDIYFRRVLAYTLAKTAARQSNYLWGPLATFVVSPYTDDEGTLVNILTALQIYDEHDEILSAVLAPEFGAFATHCITSGTLVAEALLDLLLHLNDRSVLLRLLSRSQAQVAREQLGAVILQRRRTEKDAILAILQESAFPETLPDETFRIDHEEELLFRQPPTELDDSAVSRLRSVLANARSSYELRNQAAEVDGVVQEIKLTGKEPSKGRLTAEIFERLVRFWRTAIHEMALSLAPTMASSMTTYMLPTAEGSFVMRFLIASASDESLAQRLDEIAELAEKPEKLSSRTQLTTAARSNIVQFVETLAQKELDATVGVVDPRLFEKPRKRLVSSTIRPAIEQIRADRHEHSISHQFSGTLEGASYRLATFEAFADEAVAGELRHVKGDVPSDRRSMLLHKVIGHRYKFAVEERVTIAGTGEERRQWNLESLNSLDGERVSESSETLEEARKLLSAHVPQQDNLDRIVAVLRLLANGTEVRPTALGMPDTQSSLRHIEYMRQAARILGLLADDGSVTAVGQMLARLPESRVLDLLSVQFELSTVGRLWKKWSEVADLHHLNENSAVQFLLESGLTPSMAERRGRTLRTWLLRFKSLRSGG
jgi:hypothetical protein